MNEGSIGKEHNSTHIHTDPRKHTTAVAGVHLYRNLQITATFNGCDVGEVEAESSQNAIFLVDAAILTLRASVFDLC